MKNIKMVIIIIMVSFISACGSEQQPDPTPVPKPHHGTFATQEDYSSVNAKDRILVFANTTTSVKFNNATSNSK